MTVINDSRNNLSNNGRHIKQLWFFNNDGDQVVRPDKSNGETLIYFNEYHGDNDQDWACMHNKEGKEIARYNIRLASSVCFED